MIKNLIIVDDEKVIRETLKDFFEDCGWDVRVFRSGEEALQFITDNPAGYVIVDGYLPGMSGSDFIRKASVIKPELKFVIYTGSFDFTIDDNLRASGITEKNIIVKPASEFNVLLNALEHLSDNIMTGE